MEEKIGVYHLRKKTEKIKRILTELMYDVESLEKDYSYLEKKSGEKTRIEKRKEKKEEMYKEMVKEYTIKIGTNMTGKPGVFDEDIISKMIQDKSKFLLGLKKDIQTILNDIEEVKNE